MCGYAQVVRPIADRSVWRHDEIGTFVGSRWFIWLARLLRYGDLSDATHQPRMMMNPTGSMVLAPGARIGSFSIESRLGAGGMGEVFRARDTRLDRSVALKVLPQLFTLDSDRLARFTREAHLLAALNHPNIAGIY